MKIVICGSMKFAQQMLEAQKILEELGHEAIIPLDTQNCADNPGKDFAMDLEHCQSYGDVIKDHFDKVEASDAILILNYPKNGIDGYIGGSTLMEIGIARHFNKHIFLLFNPPSEEVIRYSFEIKLTEPKILQGDVKNICNHL